jgi:hypothetical protein
MIADGSGSEGGGNPELIEVALRMLGNLVRAERGVNVGDKKVIDKMTKIALGGERKQAKFAARFLVLGNSTEDATRKVLEVRFPSVIFLCQLQLKPGLIANCGQVERRGRYRIGGTRSGTRRIRKIRSGDVRRTQ